MTAAASLDCASEAMRFIARMLTPTLRPLGSLAVGASRVERARRIRTCTLGVERALDVGQEIGGAAVDCHEVRLVRCEPLQKFRY